MYAPQETALTFRLVFRSLVPNGSIDVAIRFIVGKGKGGNYVAGSSVSLTSLMLHKRFSMCNKDSGICNL
jgi:hypothetical protein